MSGVRWKITKRPAKVHQRIPRRSSGTDKSSKKCKSKVKLGKTKVAKKDPAKDNGQCFHYGKDKYWKRNYKDFLAEKAEQKFGEASDREEDNQEEEMEKFYGLLENIRATRDYLRSRNKRMKKEAAKPVWKPRFEMEDFKEEAGVCSSAISVTSNPPKEGERRHGKEAEEREEKNSLDLSLSL
ncbi:hypothetical protein BHM03_00015385 [Ensete ventricosum]|nr:hypothetical protein BHM03_00015385 [Ensete ventricosum]